MSFYPQRDPCHRASLPTPPSPPPSLRPRNDPCCAALRRSPSRRYRIRITYANPNSCAIVAVPRSATVPSPATAPPHAPLQQLLIALHLPLQRRRPHRPHGRRTSIRSTSTTPPCLAARAKLVQSIATSGARRPDTVPSSRRIPNIDPLIAQQPVDLFYSVLAQPQGLGQSLTDCQRGAHQHSQGCVGSDNTRLACKSPSYKLSIKSAIFFLGRMFFGAIVGPRSQARRLDDDLK